jgi:hypothetical protein
VNLRLAYVPHVGELRITRIRGRAAMIWGSPGESEAFWLFLLLITGPLGCATSTLTAPDVSDCALLVAMLIQSLHLDAIFTYSVCNLAVPYGLTSLFLSCNSVKVAFLDQL